MGHQSRSPVINNGSGLIAQPKLDQLSLSSVTKGRTSGKIVVHEDPKYHQEITFDEYFSVDDLEGWNAQDKKALKQIITAAVNTNDAYGAQNTTSDQFAMSVVQTKSQLDFITEHVLPEKYKDQMERAATKFISDKTDTYNNEMTRIYEAFYDLEVDLGPLHRFAAHSKEMIAALKDGTSIIQKTESDYQKAYADVSKSEAPSFVEAFEKAIQHYKADQKSKSGPHWTSRAEAQVDKDINLLRERWNQFISHLDGFRNYRLPTEDKSIIDYQV